MKKINFCILLLIVLFLGSNDIRAQLTNQNEQILLHGVVMDAVSQGLLSNVHYIISNSYAGASNTEGKFSMYIPNK